MLQNTTRNRSVLAGVAGVTLALGLAVSAGAVPQLGDTGGARAEAASSSAVPAPAPRQPGDTTVAAAPPVTSAPTTVAPAAPPTTKATPTTKAAPKPTVAPTTVAPVAAATPSAPPAPVKVARRVPSAAEVQQAIATLPQYVHSILTPSPAQVAQLGDQVCTAFDQGQTFAQVKATGLQMVTQVPLTTVLPGGADWVVRTVVSLYCPGHASKLV